MRTIPFHIIEKDHLSPLEEFLYEQYRLGIEKISSPKDFTPSMHALAEKYPREAINFCDICRNLENSALTEDRYIDDTRDISLMSNLRYLHRPSHAQQFFEIIFVLEGTCHSSIGDSSVTLQKGDLCFIAPDIPHRSLVNDHSSIVYSIMIRTSTFQNTFSNIYGENDIISDFFTKNLYQHVNGSSPYILCKTDCEEFYLNIMEDIIQEELHPHKFSKRYLNTLFELFILHLLRNHEYHFTIGHTTENVENESILAILRYIQGNYQSLTLSAAAHFFNYSEAHLSRMIKQATGKNFSEIITTVKLQNAIHLLLETDKSISEIVDNIGYTDNSHFYKIFKKHYGVTPIQYRASHTT